jgi:hypothetical protein
LITSIKRARKIELLSAIPEFPTIKPNNIESTRNPMKPNVEDLTE